jgi:cell division septum initiation protein DivIVA
MDSVGVVSLVLDVSKDLYIYYRAVRDCDTDIKELRTQLLLLHETASSLTRALSRDGLSAEDKSQVDLVFTKCEDAAKELKSALERIKIDGVPAATTLEKMKAVGKKAAYPFRKATIEDLAEDVKSCQEALHVATSVLQLNISATTVEQLQELDDKLVASTTAMESGLRDLGLAHDAAKDEIVQHLLQDRKMLEEEGNRRKALAIVESLKYPQMNDREWQVHAADDLTLGDLFIGEESKRHPQIMSLLSFLEGDSGLFWINVHEIPSQPKPWRRQTLDIF